MSHKRSHNVSHNVSHSVTDAGRDAGRTQGVTGGVTQGVTLLQTRPDQTRGFYLPVVGYLAKPKSKGTVTYATTAPIGLGFGAIE